MGIQGSICFRKNFFRDVENDFIITSAIFFVLAYLFAIRWVEKVTHPFNNKKNSKDSEAD
ncbi:hypothetical protein ACFX2U_11150 [Gilliamella apicola]|uniref:hypothetical protein n=1 Tax=Gilliamella apicola TaxID=1196095 RepID=UPI003985FE39